jgi:hypothetical protein
MGVRSRTGRLPLADALPGLARPCALRTHVPLCAPRVGGAEWVGEWATLPMCYGCPPPTVLPRPPERGRTGDRRGPIPDKKGVHVVSNLMAPVGRRIGQIAAVGAVALVLAGAVASPAEAMRRRDAVSGANIAVGYCFNGGGDPNSYEYGGTIYVSCTYDDGSVVTVDFDYGD